MVQVRDPRFAGFWLRVGASLVDLLIVSGVKDVLTTLVAWVTASQWFAVSAWLHGNFVFGLFMFISCVIYSAYMTSSRFQGTIGKIVFELKVTNMRGQRLTLREAFKREIARLICVVTFGAGYVIVAFSPMKQGFHDRAANTLVIRQRHFDGRKTDLKGLSESE